MTFDVIIIGGGPAGLSAALNLGRARRRVLLCDHGPRRNAAAEQIHGFVTRDGTPPAEFRRVGRQQLEPYSSVEARDVRVEEIRGHRGAFEVRLDTGIVEARRILLCTGMIDELPDIEGFRELWGRSIFQCPYCHGWEMQDRKFGFLAPGAELLDFALLLRGWTSESAGVRIGEQRIARFSAREEHLERVEFADGSSLRLDVLFARPPQRQVALVQSLGLALDAGGYVQVDEGRQTSLPGIYAAGDLVTPVQSAILAAASAMQAAARLNHELTAELAASGGLE
jgi:thioredoxin reductase